MNLKSITDSQPNLPPAQPGHFYAVGVGPGAPDLITLRAARLVQTADVIIAPRAEKAEASLALDTVRALIRPAQEVVDHQYVMRRDESATLANWARIAGLVLSRCEAGKSVVQITIGDPLIYSTTAYLLPPIRAALAPDRVHVVPGISAFQAVAALFADPLAVQQDRLTLMPATDIAAVAQALDHCETLVLYKCAKMLAPLADLLERRGLAGAVQLVCYAEQDNRQAVYHDLRQALTEAQGYMATAIIHVGRRKWQ